MKGMFTNKGMFLALWEEGLVSTQGFIRIAGLDSDKIDFEAAVNEHRDDYPEALIDSLLSEGIDENYMRTAQ